MTCYGRGEETYSPERTIPAKGFDCIVQILYDHGMLDGCDLPRGNLVDRCCCGLSWSTRSPVHFWHFEATQGRYLGLNHLLRMGRGVVVIGGARFPVYGAHCRSSARLLNRKILVWLMRLEDDVVGLAQGLVWSDIIH